MRTLYESIVSANKIGGWFTPVIDEIIKKVMEIYDNKKLHRIAVDWNDRDAVINKIRTALDQLNQQSQDHSWSEKSTSVILGWHRKPKMSNEKKIDDILSNQIYRTVIDTGKGRVGIDITPFGAHHIYVSISIRYTKK